MNKLCTSIKQSQKLIDLGIDVDTADMFWKNGVSDKYIQCFTPFVSCGTNIDYDYDIPAWSLAALLKYLHKFRAQGYIPILLPTENKWILNFVEHGHGTICKVVCYDPVDACVGTILTIVPILKLRGINIL